MPNTKPRIVITMGDPTGVGPEIIAATLAEPEVRQCCRFLVVGDSAAMARGITVAGAALRVERTDTLNWEESKEGVLPLWEISSLTEADMQYGCPTVASGDAMYRAICEAARLCLEGNADAMATAPISKEALNRAGHRYPGHTELLAELAGAERVVMMLAGFRLRVTLVTIHEALADVPRLVTFERVLETIRITHRDLHRYFRRNPRIAVLALNPHCGEGGMFGDEEARIIAPAVAAARQEGIDAIGPLSADTLFHFAVQGAYDAVVCMYHDQGLIPLKLLHFDDGVNVTLGLPIIRTSVDHGTAYDLAGTGRASAESMKAAILMAAEMARVKGSGGGTP
ncbi:4-hydroxythreonine-4-phosphate dehydrogenase [Geobacter metallireducens GS-15]|uniref:4-hydroxythreonine-4-phosphate dehydrogenase n=1 Tax=Geobacter metallireducens (strain ATCC 53774 / DSM 7210 / GS-15) TaxID=269799 RepID=PDXA_GEOMG|nr:4-hydroxythreonine-4-phosphate dehydrogenase PdxA [Geobacter metallireducens]Q39Q58.1 RecName: Full=4-hydroxythreonine-4-phosphate dehydrogenase; AltName: Full=4-(phosphohydroxy)-L-threonine dehydrogenase [Geobacter metallireducens GS-15]ABB33616.1 4-hydroxythreonine-4-phosphate dehydrogenase [Geobacter metallireducens GS-15]